jgi:DNA-binding NtrC family response regulator
MKGQEDKRNQQKAIAPIGIMKNGQPVRIVVIDDTFIDRRVMTQILRSAGFDVIGEASNGEEGLMLIENTAPQMVVLDYVMPKINGLETLKQLKKRHPGLPVIMSTSESERDLAIQLMKEGADDYIVKPLDRAVILQKMKKMVEELNMNSNPSRG